METSTPNQAYSFSSRHYEKNRNTNPSLPSTSTSMEKVIYSSDAYLQREEINDANEDSGQFVLEVENPPHLEKITANGEVVEESDCKETNDIKDVLLDESKSGRKLVSKVWKFYRMVEGEEKVQCLLCEQKLSHKYHSTKGMWNHLSVHPNSLSELGVPPRPPTERSTDRQSGNGRKRKRLRHGDYIYDADGIAYMDPVTGPPVVKFSRTESFSAAHCLHNPFLTDDSNSEIYGKCNNPSGHGHNYKWTVVLKGPVEETTGMVYNLQQLKQEMGDVLDLVDHKNLDKDVSYFRDNGMVSTTENLAIFLFNELASRMMNPTLLKKVIVGETDKNEFAYSGEFLSNPSSTPRMSIKKEQQQK